MDDAPLTGDPRLDRLIEAEPNSGCWVWIGWRSPRGYGVVRRDRREQRAHRYIYQRLHGELPRHLTLDHLCRNHPCVNPAHMEPVTQRENVSRGDWGGGINCRKTHCAHGHEFTEENTLYWRTERICRLCSRATRLRRSTANIKGRYKPTL